MSTLKDQYDAAAQKLAAEFGRRNATRYLALLQEAVQAFRDEGFDVSMAARPDKLGLGPFSESYGNKILFNGEVTAEGQKIDFAVFKGPGAYDDMNLKLSWGGETLMNAVSAFHVTKNWHDKSVFVAGETVSDEYGEDPAPLPEAPQIESAIRTALVKVLVSSAAAAKYNVATPGAADKNFKVPATIKLAKDKTP